MCDEKISLETIENSSVAKFFNRKNVFITGATGFMGKVLVRNLFSSKPLFINANLVFFKFYSPNVDGSYQY